MMISIPQNNNKKTILLVEDDSLVGSVQVELLEKDGYYVFYATSGEKALEIVKSTGELIDFVLMDIDLGQGIDGIETARKIQEYYFIPIVFTTGHKEKEIFSHLNDVQSFGFIVKNTPAPVWLASIRMAANLCDAHKKLKENEKKYRQLIELAHDGILTLDVDGIITFSNPQMAAILELQPEEILGRSLFDWMEKKETNHVTSLMNLIAERKDRLNDIEFLTAGGRVYLHLNATPLKNEMEDCTGYLIVASDMTERRKIEEKLRKSKDDWETIFQAIGHPAMIITPDNQITAVNNAVLKALNLQESEIIGKKCYEIFHGGEKFPSGLCPLEIMKISGELESRDMEVEALNGIFLVSCTPIKDGSGNVDKIIHIATDISRLKCAEKELEMARFIIDHASDAVFWISSDAKFIYINDSACRLLGYSQQELLSLSIYDLDTKYTETTWPDYWIELKKLGSVTRELSPKTKDGHHIPVEICISYMAFAHKEYCVAFARDISERKRNEQLLMRERNLFVSGPVVAFKWVALPNWPLEYVSPNVTRFGFQPDDFFSGKVRYMDIIHPEDKKRILDEVDLHLQSEASFYEQEYRIINPTGQQFWIHDHTVVVRNHQGMVTHFDGFILDITDRKKADEERLKLESQILQTQKLESLGILAGGIAHDFNNLLMTILGNLDLALMGISNESPARPNLQSAKNASFRAADLCNQMLAYSGKGRFIVEALDINNIIKGITHILDVSVGRKATLVYHPEQDIPLVDADATQLRQVIMNLVINAAEAIPGKDGVISISTSVQECSQQDLYSPWIDQPINPGLYISLEIADNGTGMDEDTLKRIFDPFFTTKFTGRGLGLAAVIGIVRSHKGTIQVSSLKSRGTVFKVLLPISQKNRISHHIETTEELIVDGDGIVLLVDDETFVLETGKEMLEAIGFNVITAANGPDALKILKENALSSSTGEHIACIILDLTMPNMDGEETFIELRRIREDIPIIMSSGYSEQEISKRFKNKEISGFIQKPYQLVTLQKKMKEVIHPPASSLKSH